MKATKMVAALAVSLALALGGSFAASAVESPDPDVGVVVETQATTEAPAAEEVVEEGEGAPSPESQKTFLPVTPDVSAPPGISLPASPQAITPVLWDETLTYLYQKLNPSAPASFSNSGVQNLIATLPGHGNESVTLANIGKACGPGWAIQEDDITHNGSFVAPPSFVPPATPLSNAGVLVNARHANLETYLTVPPCKGPPILPVCTTVTSDVAIIGDGVITVEGDWEEQWIDVPFTGTLKDIGTVLDIQASPLQYVGLHIDTSVGTIVFEYGPGYDGRLWSKAPWSGVSAGMGYPAFGSISEFIAENGDVVVTGIRLLYTHPEESSTTVTSFTIGCTVFTFIPKATAPEPDVEKEFRETHDCVALTITTTEFTRTTGEPTYNAKTNTWTQGAFGEWEQVGLGITEPMTPDQIAKLECAPPETPPVTGKWVTGKYECGDKQVTETRTISTTTYVPGEGVWIDTVTVTLEEQTRDLTKDELAKLDCPVPGVTVLQRTGSELATGGILAGGLFLLGLSALVARRATRVQQ